LAKTFKNRNFSKEILAKIGVFWKSWSGDALFIVKKLGIWRYEEEFNQLCFKACLLGQFFG